MSEGLNRKEDNKFRPIDSMDQSLEREIAEALGDMSLEEMIDMEEGARTYKPSAPGVKMGKVISIQRDDIFVDLGGKSQGLLSASQFEDQPLPNIGDMIEVVVVQVKGDEGLLILSLKGASQSAAWETIQEGDIVEGRVTGHNKGGLEVDIQGIRAFMPISQIEIFRVEDISGYGNQRFKCVVSEVDRANKNVILSRRTLLEKEAAEAREKSFGALAEGQILSGTVRTIMPYGAFVDLGGVDGLLHVRDMSYARVDDPRTVVKEGDKLEVKVLKIDRETKKISLGLKQVMVDPWMQVSDNYSQGTVLSGKITRLADFGAFVELEPGVEGIVPISEMSFQKRIKHPSELCSVGDSIQVRVMKIDSDQKRISLSIKQVGDDPWMGASVRWSANSIVSGIVRRITDFGAFVELSPGVEGLVHISEVSDKHIRSVADVLKEGDTTSVKVLNVSEEEKRISLSIKQAAAASAMMSAQVEESQPQDQTEVNKPKRKVPLKGGF